MHKIDRIKMMADAFAKKSCPADAPEMEPMIALGYFSAMTEMTLNVVEKARCSLRSGRA